MNNKAYNLKNYSFSKGEQILLDTNIWLYLYPAPVNPCSLFAGQYSAAFKKLIEAEAQPVIDPLVLGEYLNRYCRIIYNAKYKEKFKEYKTFRQSKNFAAIAEDATSFAREILAFCQRHSLPANELDLPLALTDFKQGKLDFTDSLLLDICKKKNLKLMTNDSDFRHSDITVLTTNPRLLRPHS